ncbi:MAG: CopD family protein, partial [Ktedonobacteraceae bacterium]|nr:CopD family protein [Ktedonobacteraceae bacterium]
NVSAEDGHHVKSNFSFVVGAGPLPGNTSDLLDASSALDENFSLWSITLRWLNYLGMAGLVGMIAFLVLVWQPGTRLASQDIAMGTIHKANARLEKRASSLVWATILILLCGWIAFLLYQSCIDSGLTFWALFRSQALSATLFQSRFGTVWLIRLALIVGTIPCWFSWSRRQAAIHTEEMQASRSSRWSLWLLLLLGTGMMLTTSLNSHAAASKDAWFLLPADLVHLLSTGFWIGGLLLFVSGLAAVWPVLLPGTGDRTRLLAVLLPRFSRLALISVLLLVLTGTLQAIVQLGTLTALFTTNYGLALCLKLGIFFVLLCLGAFHLLRVSPRMRLFSRNSGEEDGARSLSAGALQRTFRRTVGVEAGLAILVLLVVGGLTSLSPPPPPQQQRTQASSTGPFVQRGQASNLSYILVINPGRAGPNTFEVDLHDASGKPISDAEAVALRFTMLDMDMGVQDVPLQPVASTPGRYSGTASVLGMSGHWSISLLVQRSGYDDASIPIAFAVP